MSGINAEEYLKADDDLMVFAGVTEEHILSEITDEMENDDDDTDKKIAVFIDIPVSSSISSVPGIFSSLSSKNVDHFRALNSMQILLVDLTAKH
ncbi:hypothetical protein AVEN_207235-1 [Araneus ventricosus]|uniref:Uncharacterized protein n=1 Tax=Araneus ventricosus TaxID=182803 RepID=A0A4Y2I996_ARAVE|nr:hypothetical protein AVEN_207235-1 [Araneus ventricosus]